MIEKNGCRLIILLLKIFLMSILFLYLDTKTIKLKYADLLYTKIIFTTHKYMKTI